MDVGDDERAVEKGLNDFGGGFGLEVFALRLECGGGQVEDGLEDDGGDARGEVGVIAENMAGDGSRGGGLLGEGGAGEQETKVWWRALGRLRLAEV